MKYFKILSTPPPFSLEHGHCPAAEPRSKESSFLSALKCALACFALVFFVLAGNAHAQTANCPHTPSDPPTDKDALIALYCATDGDNWTSSNNWLTNEPLDEWEGVDVDANGRVSSLTLDSNGLSGSIPAELENLTNLQQLRISQNQLSGEIPSSLGNLTSLQYLSLSRNQLSGPIPSSLGNLTSLQYLYLWDNELSGEIPDLSRLTGLRQLSLSLNMLSGEIPSSLGTLSSLQYLYLLGNRLTGEIPTELGNLTSLERLQFDDNMLTGEIPTELENLTNLQQLRISQNQLSGEIPSSLGNLTSLQYLSLSRNQLSGPIPSSLGNLTSLQYLYLWDNELSGEIPDLSRLTGLRQLSLSLNMLSGEIPSSLGTLSSLQYLYLLGNRLTGEIPTELGNLTSLERLQFDDNMLTGEIPTELENLTNLQQLRISQNQLSGEIPSSLGNLTSLQYLSLSRNQLSGPIPSSLGNLTSLQYLYLWDNELSGEIPDLSRLTGLRELSLSLNMLSGEIPSSLGTLSSLQYLYLSRNQLSGEIPTELGNLSSLERLELYDNMLTGEIPTELGNLTSLELLYLYDNMLTGSVPATELGNLANLQELGFWGNEGLTWDAISNELGQKVDRAVLRTLYDVNGGEEWSNNDNWFSSEENPAIFSFSSWHGVSTDMDTGRVSGLNLGNNGLKEELTNALEALDGLKDLNISNNRQLTGELPLRLRNLPLETLDIRCTDVSTPTDAGFQTWLSGITFREACPPPPSPPSPPSPPESPDDTVLVIEENERFIISPMSEEGSITYNGETIEVTLTRDENLSSESASPAIIVSPDLLGRVEEITFELSEDSPEAAPSGFRLEGFVADIDLGVELGEGESVEVCLPAPEDGGESALYHYDEGEGMWNRLESRVKTISGERLVCAETDALPLFGVFVAGEEVPGPPSPGGTDGSGGGGGCALASDGGTVDGLGSELLNLLLIVSFLLAVSQGSRSEAGWM